MGKVIAVANQKGGVGKTTTAINLSASLALSGQRILLIDMDPQANTTSGLGQSGAEPSKCLYEVLIGQIGIRDSIYQSDVQGLDVAVSAPRLFAAEVELVHQDQREYILKKELETLIPEYNYVILDCPPSLGLLTINGIVASHSVLIPMQCEYFALEGLSQLLQTIRMIQESLNPDLLIEGVLLTMYDGRLSLSQQVAEEARKYFGDRVFKTMIPRNVRLGEAPSFGKPVALYAPNCIGAACYMKLAKEVASHGEESTWARAEGSHS